MKYKNLTIGGTFDHLHEGHQAMLTQAFAIGETIWLGITTDEFVQQIESKKLSFPNFLEPFKTRKATLTTFLAQHKFSAQARIVPILNRFGTTLMDQSLEAIVVSPETEPVAHEINKLRTEKYWNPLQIILVPWVLAEDKKPINSIRIRAGEISRSGELFSITANWGLRKLPDHVRLQLKAPLGELIVDQSKNHEDAVGILIKKYNLADSVWKSAVLDPHPPLLIAVGDAVTQSLLVAGCIPQLAVIDFHIGRKRVYQDISEFKFPKISPVMTVSNPAATLSGEGFIKLQQLIRSANYPAVLQVDGEEDLFTLFAILAAPLHSLVVYGQPASSDTSQGGPGEGIVAVLVTEEKKQEIKGYVDEFLPQ